MTGPPAMLNITFKFRAKSIAFNSKDVYLCFIMKEMQMLFLQKKMLLKTEKLKKIKMKLGGRNFN
tara:strand:- start:208 stop:402 length:195 start_codon:yes stop_codon:yes gene_type:complete